MRLLSFGLFAAAALGIAAPANAAPAPRHGFAGPAAHFHAGPGPAVRFHARPAIAARIGPPAFRFHRRPVVGVVPAPVVVWEDWDWPPPVWETDFAYVPTCHIVRERVRTKKHRTIIREREVCD